MLPATREPRKCRIGVVLFATMQDGHRRASAARSAVLLAVLLAVAAATYFYAGLGRAYLAADDFQWLSYGHTFTLGQLVSQIAGNRFYRPAIDLWFAAGARVCGFNVPCLHFANLALHLVTVSLVFALALNVLDDLRIACMAALFFSLEPGYTQAVVWVSGVTGLLMTTCYLGSHLAQARSWSRSGIRRLAYEAVAAALFLVALLAHEAAITLPVTSWILWRQFAPARLSGRRFLVGTLAASVLLFAVLTMLANHRNAVFTQSEYAFGVHVLRHGLDYIVSMYVGPSSWPAYSAVVIAVACLVAATPATRFGALWLVVTMLPYLGFTWGNVSRYLYLPSIGFSWAVAAALVQGADWCSRRTAARAPATRAAIGGGLLLAAVFVAVRFLQFDLPSIRSQVAWTDPWRAYADDLVRDTPPPTGRTVQVTMPPSDVVDPMYVGPLVQWVYQDYQLGVVVDR